MDVQLPGADAKRVGRIKICENDSAAALAHRFGLVWKLPRDKVAQLRGLIAQHMDDQGIPRARDAER